MKYQFLFNNHNGTILRVDLPEADARRVHEALRDPKLDAVVISQLPPDGPVCVIKRNLLCMTPVK